MAHSEQYEADLRRRSVTEDERRDEQRQRQREPRTTARVLAGTSATEALAGAGAAVLAILGLVGILPLYMAAIATIAVGAALIIEGAGIASRFGAARESLDGETHEAAVGGGMSVELLGGAAGVILGVLALIGISPWVLMPAAAIVFGGTLLIGAGAAQEMEQLVHARTRGGESLHRTASASQGARVLVGIGAGVLGILVLAGVGETVILTLVAMLALGAAELIFGSAFGARMAKAA